MTEHAQVEPRSIGLALAATRSLDLTRQSAIVGIASAAAHDANRRPPAATGDQDVHLSVEIMDGGDPAIAQVALMCDEAGLDLLIRKLSALKGKLDHEHLMTPAWAGHDLSEDRIGGEGCAIVNHLMIAKVQDFDARQACAAAAMDPGDGGGASPEEAQ